MGPEAVDVVLALDADAGVLDAGDELDELVVVVADVAARVGGREDDVVALGGEVGDGLLGRVKFGLVSYIDRKLPCIVHDNDIGRKLQIGYGENL